MRIAVFIHEDYDFLFDMLKELLPKLKKDHTPAGVLCFPSRLTKYKGFGAYLAYLKIFGLAVFSALALRSVIKRLSIAKDFILRRCPFYSFEGMCRSYGLKKENFTDPNDASVIKWVRDNEIDVVIISLGFILKRDIINAPKICMLNKHAGALPAYKGIFPVFWTMMNGDAVGVSIHKVTEDIDSGEVVLQKIYDKSAAGSVYDYYKLIFADTPGLLSESLDIVAGLRAKGPVPGGRQASYFGLPARADYRKFKKLGYKFL